MQDREIIRCARCGSMEFGIEAYEEEDGYYYEVYCKFCLRVEHQWAYPKEEAFK